MISRKILIVFFILVFTCLVKIKAQTPVDSFLSLENAMNSLDDSAKIKLLVELSWYYRAIKSEKSLDYAKQGLEFAIKEKDKKNEATFYNILGVTNSIIGRYEVALEYHLKGLSIREKNNDTAAIAASLNNIGNVYERLEEFDKALEYYKKSLKLKRLLKNQNAIVISLNNVGYALRKLGKLDEALPYYIDALKINEKINDKSGLSLTFSNLGLLYREKKQFQSALDYAFRSLKLREEINDVSGIALQYFIIGTIYHNMSQFNKAIEFFNKSLSVAKRQNYRDVVQDCYNFLSSTYKKIGNYKTALDYHEKYVSIRYSLINEVKTKRILELQEVYKSKQHEADIQKLQLEKINQVRNYGIAFFIFLAIVAAIYFNRYRLSKKLLKSLRESEKFNNDLINNIPEYLFLFDGWKIIYTNKLAQDVFGYSKEEFEELDIFQLVAKDYHELIWRNKDLREVGKNIPPYEIIAFTKTGEQRNLLLRSIMINKENSKINLVLCSDITELKNYEKELIIAKDRAENFTRNPNAFKCNFKLVKHARK